MTFPRSCLRFFHDCREATLLSLWGNKLVLWSRSERDEQRRRGQQIGTNKALASLLRSCPETCFGWRSMLFWFRGSCHDNSIHRLFFLNIFRVWGPGLYLFRPGRSGIIYATFYWTASYYLLKVGFIKRHGTQDDNPFISPRLGIH